jgi:LDH2 family malate/lactate/ureidoglycolate dehydrogenase
MADAIAEAHLRGVETHGLRRVRPYVARIKSGGVVGTAEPKIETHDAFVVADGCNGIGHYVGSVIADAVGESTAKHGISIGVVKNSNHFGFAGYYATRIAARGQIGIVISNGQVSIGPAGTLRAFLSNNPLAIAAPISLPDRYLELDLATSVTSRANIVEAAQRGRSIPEGWAQDQNGKPTQDAQAALAGTLLPFAGARGLALLLALEAISGVLAGGAYADLVASKEATPGSPEGTAHTFIGIDLAHAMPVADYADRLTDMLSRFLALPMAGGSHPLRYPGERRWRLRAERLVNGIELPIAEFNDIASLARENGIGAPL